jgi:ubiquinone/menaquinone biosynthesis C-methylase UbiE
MTEFENKLKIGIKPNASDWTHYLVQAHKKNPSMTPQAFFPFKSAEGFTSYEILANKVKSHNEVPKSILDLACGDGFLINFILQQCSHNTTVHALDMSDAELEIAKTNFQKNENVEIQKGLAQNLPFIDNSIDLILCHMAFMLMLPIEDVIKQIHRVLSPGGIFSAVISNVKEFSGFYKEIQMITKDYIQSRYPVYYQTSTGEVKLNTIEGIKELFSTQLGFESEIDVYDYQLVFKANPEQVWNFMKTKYFISSLSHEEMLELKNEIINHSHKKMGDYGTVDLVYPMRQFSVTKAQVT